MARGGIVLPACPYWLVLHYFSLIREGGGAEAACRNRAGVCVSLLGR